MESRPGSGLTCIPQTRVSCCANDVVPCLQSLLAMKRRVQAQISVLQELNSRASLRRQTLWSKHKLKANSFVSRIGQDASHEWQRQKAYGHIHATSYQE